MEFKILEKEWERCKAFQYEHKDCCRNQPFTTLGMQFTYIITPGGLGNLISIKCNACGKSKDCTAIELW